MLSRLTFIQMWINVHNSLDSRCSIDTMYAAISVSEVEGIEVGGRIQINSDILPERERDYREGFGS